MLICEALQLLADNFMLTMFRIARVGIFRPQRLAKLLFQFEKVLLQREAITSRSLNFVLVNKVQILGFFTAVKVILFCFDHLTLLSYEAI